jgi:hypothetical protein
MRAGAGTTPAPTPEHAEVLCVRKLILTSTLIGLVAVPTAFAATGSSTLAGVEGGSEKVVANSQPIDYAEVAANRRHAERLPEIRKKRADERQRDAELARQSAAAPPHLEAIAACESGGDPTAIGGGGLYRGKYQFSVETWAAVGGSGDPAAAPEAEQDRRAAMLYEQSGPGQWPVCGS